MRCNANRLLTGGTLEMPSLTGSPGPRGYKKFSCSTEHDMVFIMLINVKMPTIVGILTFMSRIIFSSFELSTKNVL